MHPTSPATSQPDAIQSDPDVIPNHPLAAIAGKFEGELWDATLAEIQKLRCLDRQNSESLIEDWTIDAGMNYPIVSLTFPAIQVPIGDTLTMTEMS